MNLKDRIEALQKQIEELEQNKKSLSSAFDSTSESLETLFKLGEKGLSEDLVTATLKTAKKHRSELLDLLMLSDEIIRKISPSASALINVKISNYEKFTRRLFELCDLILESKIEKKDIAELSDLTARIDPDTEELTNLIKICRTCIKETFEKMMSFDSSSNGKSK